MSHPQDIAGTVQIAMVGMVEGNGHPYSWSAIINGYDSQKMADCPYPVIAEYLAEQDKEEISLPDAQVTHIWTEKKSDAENVASATYIENVVDDPEDIIGEVDAVIIPTDDGDNHVHRVKPLIESGLPIFIDKPLATNVSDLQQFIKWYENGHPITSSSAMRYAPAVDTFCSNLPSLGDLSWLTNVTHKTWIRYGIHVLEPITRIIGPGFQSVHHQQKDDTNLFTIEHESGPPITIAVKYDLRGSFGTLTGYGTDDICSVKISDTYTTFRRQLQEVVKFAGTGEMPVPFAETVDLMCCIIAGRWSKNKDRRVKVTEVYEELSITQGCI